MFENHFFGSRDFLEQLRGNVLDWNESRLRRRAMYAKQAAPASSAATMQAVHAPRAAPAGHTPGPTDGLVLVCYRHEQGQFVPVYAHAADIQAAASPTSAPPAGDCARGPEAAPPAAAEPASPPPEAAPAKVTTAVPPPDFSAESVKASSPPQQLARQAPMIDLPPPERPPLMRASEEKAEEIERLLAAHRTAMEAAEARHTTAVQGILAGHRSDMEAAETRHKTAVQEILEALEARQSAAVKSALTEHMQSISELIASRLKPAVEPARPDADALAFAQLRALLTEQAGVMKDEHDKTTSALRDIGEVIANLGAIVSGVSVAVAEQRTPTFPPPRRTQAQGEGAQHTPMPKAASPVVTTPTPPPSERIPAHGTTSILAVAQPPRLQPAATPSVTAPTTGPATASAVPAQPAPVEASAPATPALAQPTPAVQPTPEIAVPAPPVTAVQPASTVMPTQSTPAPTAAPVTTTPTQPEAQPTPAPTAAPVTTAPPQPAATPQASSPATPSPPPQVATPTRPLTVVRESEPIRGAPPPVHRTTSARTSPSSVTASLEHIFATGPQVTASASPTPRQRREAEEARERDHIRDLVDDVPDDELADVQDEDEASHV
ncbi:MAG: hypothetical protein JNL82_17520 [Myxococcales bacterium]|nr:hypothetical protein [Myxococcales bacterium]